MEPFQYQPAKDHGLDPAEAAKSPLREPGLVSRLCSSVASAGIKLYLRLWHRLEIEGLDALPSDRPVILIANHNSHLDALCLIAALPHRHRRRASPLAAGDVFFPRPLRGLFSSLLLNAFPVWRGQAGNHCWQTLRQRLFQDRLIYILFPEGRRSPDGKLCEFKAGWARLLCGSEASSGALILPCRIDGAFEALPRSASLPRPRKIRLCFGPAFEVAALPDERASWEQIAARSEEAIRGLGAE